jgi:hypothetical protein
MALPSLDKTWQYNVNNLRGNTGDNLEDNRDILFMIKQSLIGETFGGSSLGWTGTWTVQSSSPGDGTFGAGDNWADVTDIVWANVGTNHSWIVFRQAATGSEFCVDCRNSNDSYATIAWSHSAGFGVGSATNRPTATDEIELITNAFWVGGLTTPFAARIHTMISTDGECTRVYAQIRNLTNLVWLFDLAKNPVSGWVNPSIALARSGSSTIDMALYTSWNEADNIYGYHGATAMTLYASMEGADDDPLVEQGFVASANDIDGSWPMLPAGLVSETAGARGRHGELFDFWFGSGYQVSGTTYPDDLSRQFAQFGNIIVPWNGSAPQVIG